MQSIGPTLTVQDSLNLLTTQLRNQDPLEPTDNAQLVTQMTQINQAQQMAWLTDAVRSMATSVRVSEATGLIGKTVELANPAITGTVTAVTIQNGTPRIVVNGQEVGLETVRRIY